ncbi:hypothetical protein FHS57_004021 [Runella defluvii]|uniref:YdhG-like domain-containing protein n=1 Tax=Runella defluvii TaxID=370973 RepID=A0A7W5ZNB4_9BACT|nr:DUF1801 domain-containing protein [Runella defluvii]MBB3840008.1 hypothetical protein [Runella defluvii]
MSKNKTTETNASVSDFLNAVKDETKRADSFKLVELFESITGSPAKLWGPSIVGFGSYHYKYESGREGEAPLVAFSPRAAALTVYLSTSFDQREELLSQLGKYKTEKGCIYIKRLSEVNLDVLEELIIKQIEHTQQLYN